MKTNEFFKREWLLWLIVLSPLVLIGMKWDLYPDKIPTHWNVDGDVDAYGGKWALFLSPVINIGIYLLMLILPKIDPRKKNYDLFSGTYFVIRIIITVFLCMIGFVTCLASLGVKLDVALIIQLASIALFLIMGNYFGKIRPNYFVGLRTPWTLNNEEVWMRSHRFAGKLWVICSLAMLMCLFLLTSRIYFIVFMALIGVMVILPMIYSWAIHKKVTANSSN